jgi:hypothetical protein
MDLGAIAFIRVISLMSIATVDKQITVGQLIEKRIVMTLFMA